MRNLFPQPCYNTAAYGGGEGITISQERGANAGVSVSNQISTSNTLNTNYAGQSGIITAGDVSVLTTTNNATTTNTFDGGALRLAGDIVRDALDNSGDQFTNALNFASNANNIVRDALDNSDDQFRDALNFASNANNAAFDAINDLVTFNATALRQEYEGVTNALLTQSRNLTDTIRAGNSETLSFFAGQTRDLLAGQRQGSQELAKATVNAIDTVAMRTQSQDAQQLTQLQGTLVKLALGMGVVIVTFAYFNGRKN